MLDPNSGVSKRLGLIGGIGLTEVHVYAQRPAPDGTFSGCPHVHSVTDEAYYVLRGSGHVEFHDLETGYRKLSLALGDYLHFPPLVLHRLISDGDLIILGMMGNAGLAERGEARIYFGPDADADPAEFDRLVSLPRMLGLDGALERRDAAVAGYGALMRLWHDDRAAYFAELDRFIDTHCRAMAAKAAEFRAAVASGPQAWATETLRRIDALPACPPAVPPDVERNRVGDDSAFGMCGVLRPVLTLKRVDS